MAGGYRPSSCHGIVGRDGTYRRMCGRAVVIGFGGSERTFAPLRQTFVAAAQRASTSSATAMTTTAMKISVSMRVSRHMVRLYVDGPAAGFVPPAPPVVNDQAAAQLKTRSQRKTWLRDFDIYRLDLSVLLPLTSRHHVDERPRDAA